MLLSSPPASKSRDDSKTGISGGSYSGDANSRCSPCLAFGTSRSRLSAGARTHSAVAHVAVDLNRDDAVSFSWKVMRATYKSAARTVPCIEAWLGRIVLVEIADRSQLLGEREALVALAGFFGRGRGPDAPPRILALYSILQITD